MKLKLKNIASNTGRFVDGNPKTGELGTIVTAEWLNDVQDRVQDVFEEIKNVLALANLQPLDNGTTNQVAEAIRTYCNNLNLKIQSNTRNFDNYISNSKKSNAVNSNSADTVATSNAVKTAYDKGVEALNKANTKADSTDPILKTTKYYSDMNTIPDGTLFFSISNNTKNQPLVGDNGFDAQAWQFDVGNQKMQWAIYTESDLRIRYNDNGTNWGQWTSLVTTNNLSSATNNNSNNIAASVAGVKLAFDNAEGRLSKKGGQITGHLEIKQSDYSSLRTYNSAGASIRWESAPQSSANFGAIVSVDSSGSVDKKLLLPKLNGTFATQEQVNDNYVGYLSGWGKRYAELITTDANYGGIQITRTGSSGSWNCRLESLPNRSWKFWSNSDGKGFSVLVPPQDGTIALVENFSYQKIGNFEIRKYPDGTMIQTNIVNFKGGYQHNKVYSFNWAVAFKSAPMVFGNPQGVDSFNFVDRTQYNIRTKSTGGVYYYYLYDEGGEQGDWDMQFLAIGRWK